MKSIVLIIAVLLPLATTVHADNQIYAVQVLMAREYDNALNEYKRLKDRHPVRIERINNAFLVRVGAYSSKASALASLKLLKSVYPDAFIVKYLINHQLIVQESAQIVHPKQIASLSRQNQKENNTGVSSTIKTSLSHSTQSSDEAGSLQDPKQGSKIPDQSSVIMKPSAPGPLPEEPASTNQLDKDDDLLKAGMQSYYDGKLEASIGLLSKYVSLAPNGQMRAAAMLVIGKSLEQLRKPKAALDIFGQILTQYPDKAESLFSIVAMADISVNRPGLVYPIGRPGAEYVKDPIHAYDTVLARNVPQAMIEHIQYYKGLALWKLKHYERAWEAQSAFLKNFPSTVYRKEVQMMLKDVSANLINHHYFKGDHISVVQYFLQGWADKLITSQDSELLLKSAASLSALGLHDDSSNIIKLLKGENVTNASVDINKIVAEIEKKRSGDHVNQHSTIPSWDKYHAGREYLRINDLTKAEKTFADLKNSEPDPFWSKIIDYAREEKKWAQKYPLAPMK